MAFVLKKSIDLGSVAPEWQGCSLSFNSPTYAQIKKLQKDDPSEDEQIELSLQLIEELFIDGTAFDGSAVVPVTKANLQELPLSVLTLCFSELAGQLNPKSNES